MHRKNDGGKITLHRGELRHRRSQIKKRKKSQKNQKKKSAGNGIGRDNGTKRQTLLTKKCPQTVFEERVGSTEVNIQGRNRKGELSLLRRVNRGEPWGPLGEKKNFLPAAEKRQNGGGAKSPSTTIKLQWFTDSLNKKKSAPGPLGDQAKKLLGGPLPVTYLKDPRDIPIKLPKKYGDQRHREISQSLCPFFSSKGGSTNQTGQKTSLVEFPLQELWKTKKVHPLLGKHPAAKYHPRGGWTREWERHDYGLGFKWVES